MKNKFKADVLNYVNDVCGFATVSKGFNDFNNLVSLMHDLGYVYGHQAHELQGAIMARKLMTEAKYSLMDIEIVQGLIMATIMPQKPQTKLQKILCDADLFHLSQPEFFEKSKILQQELSNMGIHFSDKQWRMENISFFKEHKYHTDFGKRVLTDKKLANLIELAKP